MSSGQQWWYDKQQEEAYQESNRRRAEKSAELGVPIELGLKLAKLEKLVRENRSAYNYDFGRALNSVVDDLSKFKIE